MGKHRREGAGGARPGSGRKAIGETRVISITLPAAEWRYIDKLLEEEHGPSNLADYFRLAHRHSRYDDPESWSDKGIEPVLDRETMEKLRTIDGGV